MPLADQQSATRWAARYAEDARSFARVLAAARLPAGQVSLGRLSLAAWRGVADRIQYNKRVVDLLDNAHEYTFRLRSSDLQLSLQLYENVTRYYRLFCYTRMDVTQGMTFSVNLTTQRQGDHRITLRQTLRFADRHEGNVEDVKAMRQEKQRLLTALLRAHGLFVTSKNEILLGVFDPTKGQFVDTTPDKFLNNFIAVSLIKGHFQGNKGYVLDGLPALPPISPGTAPSSPRRAGRP